MASEEAKEKSSFMLQVKSTLPISNPPQTRFFIAQLTLRILAIVFTLASICVMVTSSQTVVIFGIAFDVRYSYSSAFKFLVVADAIASALSLLSLIFVCVFGRPGSNPRTYLFIFLHDIVIMVLVISGCAAATAVGYVGRYGQRQSNWMAICDNVGKFCNEALISIVLSFLAFLSLLALTIMSATQVPSY